MAPIQRDRAAAFQGCREAVTTIAAHVLAPIVAGLVLAIVGVKVGLPKLAHLRHERCLARIAVLEANLGLRTAPPWEVLPREPSIADGLAANRRWRAAVADYAEGQSRRHRKGSR